MQKETFIIRTEWYEAIQDLCADDQAAILRNLFCYHIGQGVVLESLAVNLVWKLIEPTLSRNADNYDRRRETSAINGKLGGRKPINNLNKPNQTKAETQQPNETLSDNVYVYDNDCVYDSENDKTPHTSGIKKMPAEMALAAPGPGNTADCIYYEQEICMRYAISADSLANIYAAWIGDRLNAVFTKREARQNFAGYCAKWKENNRSKSERTFTNPSKQDITYAPSG